VLDAHQPAGRDDIGLLRLRTVACKDQSSAEFPFKDDDGKYLPSVVLDLDYWVAVPTRRSLLG
jgi:2-methylfumaryl-CoA hydratase